MSVSHSVSIHSSRDKLVSDVADRFIEIMSDQLDWQPLVNVVLTGGTVGTDILAAIGETPRRTRLDWSRVHLWWGDERWLPAGDSERNDTQANAAFLSRLDCPQENIHRVPSKGDGSDLNTAALSYAQQLLRHAPEGDELPDFDLVFLGMGPDGHVASLFPRHHGLQVADRTVIPVRNSPKPPPERISLTLPAINSAKRVWLCVSGAEKAAALSLALAGDASSGIPAAVVHGQDETIFFVDQDAARDLNDELLSRSTHAE